MAPEEARRDQLAFALAQAARAANIGLGAVALIAIMAATETTSTLAALWAAGTGGTLLLRNVLLRHFIRTFDQPGGEDAARRAMIASTLGLAGMLGLLPLLGFSDMGIELRLLITLFYCCWCAAGMASLGVYAHLYTSYLAVVLGSVAWGWFRADSDEAVYVASGLVMFGLVLYSFSRNFALRIAEGIAIRAENAELVRKLSMANEAKTRFIMSASHDLRQPLHAISLLGGVLSRAQDPEDARNAREALEGAVRGLNTLFSAILDLSKIEGGTVRAARVPAAVDQLVARLDPEYRTLCLSMGRRWECQVERAVASTDVILLERMLRNVLDNALKHGGQGAVRLTVAAQPQEVMITVSDTGPGIAVEERERVFDEFYRVGDGDRAPAGLGLGLSIVRRLAGLLGCRLAIGFTDPAARTGTCFSLWLPAAEMPSEWIADAARGPQADEPDVQGLRILVLDDEQPLLDATRALLRQWACEVAVCRDPRELDAALAQLGPPDVALVDYRLGPHVLGLQAIQPVREKYPDMGVVVVTGESDEAVLASLAESGLPVLEKPASPEELRLTLALFKTMG